MKSSVFTSIRVLTLLLASAFIGACTEDEPASADLYQEVDDLYAAVLENSGRFRVVAEIDHSRLAAAEGEVMPPARVLIFSDPEVNTSILQLEPMAGLDLPFRVLAYAEDGSPAIIFTTADFLQRRHGLASGPALRRYEEYVQGAVSSVPGSAVVELDASSVDKGIGIASLNSDYDFDQTVSRLRDAIMAESDTVWFGEIDYDGEAATLGVNLPRLKLLLWGAPAPGAKAMREFPRMGLDAFCQKTLVYQPPGERVRVLFNEMPALADMHYGDSALPHRVITSRMLETLGSAVEKKSQ